MRQLRSLRELSAVPSSQVSRPPARFTKVRFRLPGVTLIDGTIAVVAWLVSGLTAFTGTLVSVTVVGSLLGGLKMLVTLTSTVQAASTARLKRSKRPPP